MELSNKEKALLRVGQRVHAIKALRNRTGADLKDCSEAVDKYLREINKRI